VRRLFSVRLERVIFIYVALAYVAGIMNGEDNDHVVDEYVTGLIDGEGYEKQRVDLNTFALV
jgi:hypothetical protein